MTTLTHARRELRGKTKTGKAAVEEFRRLYKSANLKNAEALIVGKPIKIVRGGWSDAQRDANAVCVPDFSKSKYSRDRKLHIGLLPSVPKRQYRKCSDRLSRALDLYEMIAQKRTPQKDRVQVLERFDGVVDAVEDEAAFFTLTSQSGERLLGEYPAREFAKMGIHCGRRFICQTVVADGEVDVRFEAIPDLKVKPEDKAARIRRLEELISGGVLDGDY